MKIFLIDTILSNKLICNDIFGTERNMQIKIYFLNLISKEQFTRQCCAINICSFLLLYVLTLENLEGSGTFISQNEKSFNWDVF